jgi:hypothetical protein
MNTGKESMTPGRVVGNLRHGMDAGGERDNTKKIIRKMDKAFGYN